MKDSKNYPLIIGLIVPVLMVVFIAASIFVPRLFAPDPQYDFIYSVSDGYNPESEYLVRDGHIQHRDLTEESQKPFVYNSVRLYRHYVKENKSAGISMEEAAQLALSDATQSPDGYEIGPGTHETSFLIFYSTYPDYNELFLKGHGIGQKLNLATGKRPYYAYSDFHFIGWVLP